MAEEFDPGDKVRRIQRNLEQPTEALTQIGALMVAESQAAFRNQRHGKSEWDARSPVNTLGIIADFHAGKKAPPARRFESRPALRDTGRLAASIAFKLATADTVEVGSTLPYAAVHHHGGVSESQPINDQVRRLLGAWLKRKGKPYRKRLGWLLNKKFAGETIKTRVPKRPIVGITQQTMEDVREAVGVRIMEAGK